MSRTLQTVSKWMFFTLGTLMLAGLVLIKWGIAAETIGMILNSLDLPLLGSGMLYAGSSLYVSLTKDGKISWLLAIIITVPLVLLFLVFMYANFALPFSRN